MVERRSDILFRTLVAATKRAKRSDVIQLASDGRIGNARVQNYNGRVLLRGVGVNLDELPVENIGAAKAE